MVELAEYLQSIFRFAYHVHVELGSELVRRAENKLEPG